MTKTEERILKVWQEVFGREDFGIDDDFFELGGNSLMAMRIYMKLSEEVAIRELPPNSKKSSSIPKSSRPNTSCHTFNILSSVFVIYHYSFLFVGSPKEVNLNNCHFAFLIFHNDPTSFS